MNLYKINLNLLIALDILLNERSVTRAAKKVFLSQAAMSSNLKQLRKIFKNQLLIREKSGLVLTPYAKELQPQLHRVLEELESLVESGQSFQPLTCHKTFKIGMSDLWASLILPALLLILKNEAPNIVINIIPLTQMYSAEPFKNEEYDIGIARASSFSLPSNISKKLLSKDTLMCVLNPRHPLAKKKKITLADYAACKHVVWRTDNPEFPSAINQFLEKNGEAARDAVLYVAYIDTLFRIIETSDHLIGSVFTIAASLLTEKHNCVIKSPPFALPGVETYIAWHTRFNDDPAHRWMRNKIIDVVKKILKK